MHESRALPTCPVIGRNEERILAPSVDESAQELPPEVSAASVELRTQHLILGRESVSAGRRGMGQELGCIGSHRSVSLWRIGLRIEWPTLLSHEPINEHTIWGAVEQPVGQRCLHSLETVVEAVLAAGTDCNSPAPSPTCRWSGALRSSTQGWRRAILRRRWKSPTHLERETR